MKRILFASWYTGLGGGETDLLNLAAALDKRRYEPHLLVPREGQLTQRWREAGNPVHRLRYRGASTWFLPALWARFPAAGRMRQLLLEQEIDLAHSDYHSLPLLAPAARQLRLPLVFTLWGWWFKPKPWQRAFFRRIPATVARSIAIRDGYLGEPPFMPPERLPVVYPGVDTERFSPAIKGASLRAELGIAPDAPLVAMAARFQRVKGHHIFQDMARLLARQNEAARFIVAGDDVFGVAADKRYREAILDSWRADPVLSERLHYIGFRADIERVYAAADVVVCASLFESFGIANLEAMACGAAVVSTNRGGPAETIVPGETGLLLPPKDPKALAEATASLLNDAESRRRLGTRARRHVVERFSIAASVDAYRRVFDGFTRPS